MAEPTDKINLTNPSEVARETLRRLAMRRIAPTPDNYQALYEEIVGGPMAPPDKKANTPSADTVLAGLVMDLNLYHPQLADAVEQLNQSIRKGDWSLGRKQLGQITRQLQQPTESKRGNVELATQADNQA